MTGFCVGDQDKIVENGALGGARTHDLSLRRAALYPSELQAPVPGGNGAEGEI